MTKHTIDDGVSKSLTHFAQIGVAQLMCPNSSLRTAFAKTGSVDPGPGAASSDEPPRSSAPELSLVGGADCQDRSIVTEVMEARELMTGYVMAETRRLLFDLVAAIGERLRATSATLFARRDNDLLEPVVTKGSSLYRSGQAAPIPLWGKSIVAHVARSGRAYCSPDVRECPIYHPGNPKTKSELGMPVTDPGTASLLGVLNLESDYADKFSERTVAAVTAELNAIAMQLMCYLRLEKRGEYTWPWNPKISRAWHLRRSLARLCTRVAHVVSDQDCATCSIWTVDWDSRCLYVDATHGYDYEFLAEKTLPFESFLGKAAALPPETALYDEPSCAAFVEKERALEGGLQSVCATALYGRPRGPTNPGAPAGGVLSIYTLRGDNCPRLPAREDLLQLARFLGGMCAEFEQFRRELALSRLKSRLATAADGGRFDVVRDVCCEVFDAGACSIFLRLGDRLAYVSTTGILPEEPRLQSQVNIQRRGNFVPVTMGCADETGLVPLLAREPGRAVRLYDVSRRNGPDARGPLPPVNRRFIDSIARTDEHCRFLGVSIAAHGSAQGVIRLLRPAEQPPFSPADEALLQRLAQELGELFRAAAVGCALSV